MLVFSVTVPYRSEKDRQQGKGTQTASSFCQGCFALLCFSRARTERRKRPGPLSREKGSISLLGTAREYIVPLEYYVQGHDISPARRMCGRPGGRYVCCCFYTRVLVVVSGHLLRLPSLSASQVTKQAEGVCLRSSSPSSLLPKFLHSKSVQSSLGAPEKVVSKI